jgi:hypothetical protein
MAEKMIKSTPGTAKATAADGEYQGLPSAVVRVPRPRESATTGQMDHEAPGGEDGGRREHRQKVSISLHPEEAHDEDGNHHEDQGQANPAVVPVRVVDEQGYQAPMALR